MGFSIGQDALRGHVRKRQKRLPRISLLQSYRMQQRYVHALSLQAAVRNLFLAFQAFNGVAP
jgi:hypothetical protein